LITADSRDWRDAATRAPSWFAVEIAAIDDDVMRERIGGTLFCTDLNQRSEVRAVSRRHLDADKTIVVGCRIGFDDVSGRRHQLRHHRRI
jgi:hypothetical protein